MLSSSSLGDTRPPMYVKNTSAIVVIMLVQSVKGIPISDGAIFPGAIIKGEKVTAIIKITAATQILQSRLLYFIG